MKGLLCEIYKSSLGDCSNGGVSAFAAKVVLTGHGLPELFEPSEDAPEVRLATHANRLIALPVSLMRDPDILQPTAWDAPGTMDGGCFVYTSDSRFPADTPIRLFDRTEPTGFITD